MGTETKFNCCTEHNTGGSCNNTNNVQNNGSRIPKTFLQAQYQQQQQHQQQNQYQQQQQQQQQQRCNYSNGFANGKEKHGDILSTFCNTKKDANNTNVPFIPVHVDEHHVIDGAREILKVIRPHWQLEDVHFKTFTDGITNKLVGCFYKQPSTPTKLPNSNGSTFNGNSNNSSNGHSATTAAFVTRNGATSPVYDDNNDSGNLSDSDTDSDTVEITNPSAGAAAATAAPAQPGNNVVLVRVYGNKTDLLIDRKAETRNFLLLHSYGFAPSLYATFKNGLAYDYVPGVTLNTSNMSLPDVWTLVARRMADMHRMVKYTGEKPLEATLWKKTQSFLDLVPERFSDPEKQKRIEGILLPISRMRQEFARLYKHLETLNSPVVFAHNDLLLGNVIYTESARSVNFIDYEYANFNYQAYDIGNHFAEYAGVDEVDYARYPTREFQWEWLRVYLQNYLQKQHISEDEIERLYVQVNQFALASHIFWTIWSLIQAEHSTIDFDYIEYALLRYNEYLAKKNVFLSLSTTTTTTVAHA